MASAAPANGMRASFRLGDVVLEVDSAYQPLLDDLYNAYGDCAITGPLPIDAMQVRCSAHFFEQDSLVVLKFATSCELPNLCEIAMQMIRPRAELQYFSLTETSRPGWRLIANGLDQSAPLLAADDKAAVLDIRQEPAEVLLNFVVGVAQFVQRSVIYVHAGGVSVDGQGVLLVGRSGRGKSTTTTALASRGHAMLGDETVGIRTDSCEMVAFNRTMKLRPGRRANLVSQRLGEVPHMMRIDAQGVMCAWVRASILFPDRALPASAPLRAVFFLRSFGDHAAVESFAPTLAHIDELQALTMSLSAIVSWPPSPAQRLMRFSRLIGLFSQCRCYFLDLGTPDESAALIERVVKNA
jgi:hypothetical protein